MTPPSETRPEGLIAEQDWVRPLVRRLVRDEASAEDVLQSAWARALRRPPRAERGSHSWRSWFARVARNLALRDGVRAAARLERERGAARGERLPSTHEIAEREELRARIVAHVLALPEPYRATLVLRFYEGLEPRAIARVQNVNGSTVRNRIARGLELLRERLEREQGREWVSSCLAVLPLGSAKLLLAQAGWAGWIVKGGIVAKKMQVAAAAALVVTAGVVWFAWPAQDGTGGLAKERREPLPLAKEDSGLPAPHAGGTGETALDTAESAGARTAAPERKPADSNETAAASSGVRVFGHVRDVRGAPLQNGGTFTLQFGGSGVPTLGELPLVSSTYVEAKGGAAQEEQTEIAVDQSRADKLAQFEEAKRAADAQTAALGDVLRSRLRVETLQLSLDAGGDAQNEKLARMWSGLTLVGSTHIVFADAEGCQFTTNSTTESDYSIDGLHAGKWHTIVTHQGHLCRRQDFEIQPGERQHQLDIVLDDELSVRVKLRTPDGRELIEAVAADPELCFRTALSPVALRPGSAGRFLPQGAAENFGCGRYQDRRQMNEEQRKDLGGASGVLTIGEAPPLEAGLVMNGALIARRPISPGQEEVEFVVSLEDLRHAFATVVVHVVDAQTHAPIAGANVTIDGVCSLPSAQSESDIRVESGGTQTDAQGVARIGWVPTGKRRVYVMAPGFAASSGRMEIESGGVCELKPIELTGQARISGRVFDAQGKPVQIALQLIPLDRFDDTHEDLLGGSWESGANGGFDIPSQRRERYVLRSMEGENVLAPQVVDATQGDVGDLELHLLPAVRAEVCFTREPKEGAELRITNAAGTPVCERDLSGIAPVELFLAPGAYLAELREGAHRSGSVRFVVQKDACRSVMTLD